MEFKSLKNIESSFRQIRLFGIVFLSLCAVITVWSVWSSYRFAERQREKIYVLDNGKSLMLALSQDLSQNRPAQPRDHVPPLELVPFGRQSQRFHHRGIHHHREQGFTNHQKVTDMKKIRKSFWRAYWKLHDKKKMLVARLKGYLDGLPPKTRKRIVLAMLAAFAVLALYTFGKAVYDIGRNDGSRIVTDHAGQVELSVKPENNHNVIPYLYGTDEE